MPGWTDMGAHCSTAIASVQPTMPASHWQACPSASLGVQRAQAGEHPRIMGHLGEQAGEPLHCAGGVAQLVA